MSDETTDPIAAIVREAMDYAADHGRITMPEDYADRIREALATLAAGEAGGDSTDCPTCGDELAVYWEEGRIRGVVSLDEPARVALRRAPVTHPTDKIGDDE